MKKFLSISDVDDPAQLVRDAIELKAHPYADQHLGKNKVLGLIFFNPSLRTRMSMTKAAYNLGMQVITLDVSKGMWQLELGDGTIMDGGAAEHIKEAAGVMGRYCDVLAVRSFPGLKDRIADYEDGMLQDFVTYSGVPVINMESATLHPLQSLADWMTVEELKTIPKPKVVMTWAPHVKQLPQAVPNSLAQWMSVSPFDFHIAHPEGLELPEEFVGQTPVTHDQEAALEGSDFVYVKNWSAYRNYGKIHDDPSWMVTLDKMKITNNARLMHCLPVRRNVVIGDDALDSTHSVVLHQAGNREYSAQAVLKRILEEA